MAPSAAGRGRMSLVKIGRARLALALPGHRELLRSIKHRQLDDLFEDYAVAAMAFDKFLREVPRTEELVREYESICLDMQAEAVALLARLEKTPDKTN